MQNFVGFLASGTSLITLAVLSSCLAADASRAPPLAEPLRWPRFSRLFGIPGGLMGGTWMYVTAWGTTVGTLLALCVWMLTSVSIPGLLAWRRR